MLCTRIKRPGIDHLHVCHFGRFINGDVGGVVIVHTEQPNGALVVAQFEMLCKVTVHLRDELHGKRSAINRVEDRHDFSYDFASLSFTPDAWLLRMFWANWTTNAPASSGFVPPFSKIL